MKEVIFRGHLWEQQAGYSIGLNGFDGTFTCKRCLSTRRASRFGQTKAFTFHWQKDASGKTISESHWDSCPADS